jgi:type 1 glutamine amidotransferase
VKEASIGNRFWFWVVAAIALLPATAALAADPPAVSLSNPWITFEGKEGPGKGKSIVFVSGDEEYRSEEGLPMLAKILAKHYGFKCTVLFEIDPKTGDISPNQHDNIPGLEALDSADLMVILTRFRALPDEQMKHVDDFLNAGKGVVGLRTATHAFAGLKGTYARYNNGGNADGWQGGFGKHILGEQWVNHWGSHKKESTRGIIPDDVKDNPILRGVSDIWVSTDVYEVKKLPDETTVLVQGQVLKGMDPKDPPVEGKKNDPMMPIAWSRNYKASDTGKEGRAFCTTMGASSDFTNEGLRRLVVNACFWAAGMDVPAKADVDIVGPYQPTMYGFRKDADFPKDFKPQDFIAGAEDLVPGK